MQNKTATKRYFTEATTQNSPGKKQQWKKKQNEVGSPKSKGSSPNNPKNQINKEKGTKRKSDEIVRENGGGPLKKKKMAPFPGTGELDAKKQKQKGKNEEVKSPDSTAETADLNRAKRKRVRNSEKRRQTRRNLATIALDIQKGDTTNVDHIKEKIANIKSRDVLSKTATRKLRKLETVLKLAGSSAESSGNKEGWSVRINAEAKAAQKNVKKQEKKQNETKQKQKKLPSKKPDSNEEEEGSDDDEEEDSDYDTELVISPGKIAKKMNEESEEEEEDSGEEEEEEDDSDDEEDDSDDEADESADANTSKGEFISLQAEEKSEDDEGSDEEEDAVEAEEGSDEKEGDDEKEKRDEQEDTPKPPIQNNQQNKNNENESQQQKKSRYIVFVGNLPYDADKQQIMEHFKKIGEIQDVRIPVHEQTRKSRGFAYVEVTNEETYQKALGLHNTFIGGRKINVQYTQGGKKKGEDAKKYIKAKNFKLQGMRKQGKFPGARNPSQNRADRRMKQGVK